MTDPRPAMQHAIKRIFDISVAALVLVVLSPLIAIIGIAIKLNDRGPIFFVQERVGRWEKRFRCYKFRTMRVNAECGDGGLTVAKDDERITRVGRVLRLWTLDELPQLVNVLKGEMSIVGPRAWVPAQAVLCSSAKKRRFDVRPGMAGWAWIHGRNRLPWEERIRLDLWYVEHWSLKLDFYILMKAFVLLLLREGVYESETTTLKGMNRNEERT